MKRIEILNKIEEKISNFTVSDPVLFENLIFLDKNDIEIDSDRAIIVTPLLSKICDYSMIDLRLDDFEINMITKRIRNKNYLSLIENALEISELANQYISCLYDDDILHPIVTMTVYKGILQYTQNEYYELLCDIINHTKYLNDKHNILDILELIQINETEEYEKNFENIILPQLKQILTTNDIESVLNLLSNYIDQKIYLESGISPQISLLNSSVLGIINSIKEKTYSVDEKILIEQVENRYQKQKSIFYYYQEELLKLKIYKEKCKKM